MHTRTKRFAAAVATAASVAALAFSPLTAVAGAHDGGREGGGHGGRGPSCDRSGSGKKGSSLSVIGLTSNGRLVCFDEYSPGDARTIGTVTGLVADTELVGIDVRPASGELFGLGDAGGVYVVSRTDASAVKKSQLNVALTGQSFGVDFNPTVDRLRIIGDDGQSLRANVDTGATTIDGTLNYTAGVAATGVVGAGYTNNDADPNTATTLFDIDSTLDQVAVQAPPNAGSLNVTGKLGADTSASVGFDVYSTIRDATTVEVTGLASLTVGGKAGFYRINLLTGKASPRGAFSATTPVVDVALPLDQR
ncbi:MAG: uncharacterized protein JWM47_3211 [Acidimicrobiales bacterium]|nr:uncharacterized protein [Acidimicrobiales bacterium]